MTLAPLRPPNPARLSSELAGLFPAGVVAAELTGAPPEGLLTDLESSVISRCSEKRIIDFTGGRLCARRALEELGVQGFSLLPALDRTPLWPEGLVGSITHTRGYSAAVVGRRTELAALGLDSELMASVHEELWPRICAPPELARLQTLPSAQRAAGATLIFAAKEAFYKCQYPITGEWLEFEDIEIESPDYGAEAGGFTVLPRRQLAVSARAEQTFRGRFHVHGALLTCGVALGI
jgi:4'-phosphopantetheinyl transferase EntD